MSKRLYVGNINYKATEEDLMRLFAEAGSVDSARLVLDRVTGKLRGFGFVEMSSPDEARGAIERLNDTEFMGRTLTVNIARPRGQQNQD
jgi:RNA recognition motif-containing protein